MSSRTSCPKCAKNHNKHLDKLIPIDDVEDFIRGVWRPEYEIEEFMKLKKAILEALGHLEKNIKEKYSLDTAFGELNDLINGE